MDAAASGTRRGSRRSPGSPPPSWSRRWRSGRIKVLWIVATNPVVSQPDAGRFAAALRRAELVICQDAYFPTETGALAHVLLPAAQWPEKDGTMTNSERRVSPRAARARPARRGAAGLGDLRARGPRARPPRGVPVAHAPPQVHAEYVRTTEGRLCDQTGHLARAAATRRAAAVAVPVARAPRDGAALRAPALRHRRRPRAAGARRRTRAPADPGLRRLPAGADHGPGRAAVAHDDPHGQVAVAARAPSRTRSSKCTPTTPTGCRTREVRVRSRRGSAVLRLRVSDTVPRGRRVRAVPLGRAAPRGGRRAR